MKRNTAYVLLGMFFLMVMATSSCTKNIETVVTNTDTLYVHDTIIWRQIDTAYVSTGFTFYIYKVEVYNVPSRDIYFEVIRVQNNKVIFQSLTKSGGTSRSWNVKVDFFERGNYIVRFWVEDVMPPDPIRDPYFTKLDKELNFKLAPNVIERLPSGADPVSISIYLDYK